MCVKGPVQYWYSTVLIVKVLQVCVRRRGPLVAPLALWPLEAPSSPFMSPFGVAQSFERLP